MTRVLVRALILLILRSCFWLWRAYRGGQHVYVSRDASFTFFPARGTPRGSFILAPGGAYFLHLALVDYITARALRELQFDVYVLSNLNWPWAGARRTVAAMRANVDAVCARSVAPRRLCASSSAGHVVCAALVERQDNRDIHCLTLFHSAFEITHLLVPPLRRVAPLLLRSWRKYDILEQVTVNQDWLPRQVTCIAAQGDLLVPAEHQTEVFLARLNEKHINVRFQVRRGQLFPHYLEKVREIFFSPTNYAKEIISFFQD